MPERNTQRKSPETLLNTDCHTTLQVIADELGVTRERVRQIEQAALRKCRRWCQRNGYELADLIWAGIGQRFLSALSEGKDDGKNVDEFNELLKSNHRPTKDDGQKSVSHWRNDEFQKAKSCVESGSGLGKDFLKHFLPVSVKYGNDRLQNAIDTHYAEPRKAAALRKAEEAAELATMERGGDRGNQYTAAKGQDDTLPTTAEKLAKEYNKSPATIKRDGRGCEG